MEVAAESSEFMKQGSRDLAGGSTGVPASRSQLRSIKIKSN